MGRLLSIKVYWGTISSTGLLWYVVYGTTERALRASLFFNRANMHLAFALCMYFVMISTSPLSSQLLGEICSNKMALSAWICLNPVPDGIPRNGIIFIPASLQLCLLCQKLKVCEIINGENTSKRVNFQLLLFWDTFCNKNAEKMCHSWEFCIVICYALASAVCMHFVMTSPSPFSAQLLGEIH